MMRRQRQRQAKSGRLEISIEMSNGNWRAESGRLEISI
jgi:hypothetical protein